MWITSLVLPTNLKESLFPLSVTHCNGGFNSRPFLCPRPLLCDCAVLLTKNAGSVSPVCQSGPALWLALANRMQTWHHASSAPGPQEASRGPACPQLHPCHRYENTPRRASWRKWAIPIPTAKASLDPPNPRRLRSPAKVTRAAQGPTDWLRTHLQ